MGEKLGQRASDAFERAREFNGPACERASEICFQLIPPSYLIGARARVISHRSFLTHTRIFLFPAALLSQFYISTRYSASRGCVRARVCGRE